DLPSMDVSLHLWLDEDTVVLVGNALTRDELDFVGQMPGLFVHDLRTGSTRRLTDPETVAVAALRPRPGGGGLIAVADTDGDSSLSRFDLQAEGLGLDEIDFLSDDTTVVSGFDTDDETLVFTGSTPSSPAVLARLDLSTDDAPLMLKELPA